MTKPRESAILDRLTDEWQDARQVRTDLGIRAVPFFSCLARLEDAGLAEHRDEETAIDGTPVRIRFVRRTAATIAGGQDDTSRS